MDNNSIFLTQQKFDEIWGRVSVSEASDTDMLKAFMEYEYSDWLAYNTLSQKYTGILRTRFTEITKDESRHFKTLRARYYIFTGEIFHPENVNSAPTSPILDVLRNRYIIESSAADRYLKSAEKAHSPDIIELYTENAKDEQRHMKIVAELLGSILK